jgi:hypothetical protein
MRKVVSAALGGLMTIWLGFPSVNAQQLVPDLQPYNIVVEYYAPRDPSFDHLYHALQQRKVLEELGQFLAPLKWSKTLRLIAKQCPATGLPHPEVFYNEIEYSLIVCYQLFRDTLGPAAKDMNAGFATPREALVGGLVGAVLHEAALAAFDIVNVPVLGSAEDAADQLASFVALQFGPQIARTVIKGTYLIWSEYENKRAQGYQQYDFASESGLAQQRAYNVLCIAYGGQAATFKDFVDRGLLPEKRADDCANEFDQVHRAFNATIKPHVDEALMKKVLSMEWITPEDLK